MGTDPARDAGPLAARFVSWLGETSRRWLVVLDDLSDSADLEGLWPAGPAGQVLITATSPAILPGEHLALVHPVGAFSPREALSYLMGRLTADTDQRLGAIDLVKDLGCEPLALAQASGVIARSSMSCRDYQGYFARRSRPAGRRGRHRAARRRGDLDVLLRAGRPDVAGRNRPGGAGLAALLDGHGIPGHGLHHVGRARLPRAERHCPAAPPGSRPGARCSILERAGCWPSTGAHPADGPDEPGGPGRGPRGDARRDA